MDDIAHYNENLPFGHNPFINIPSDVDRAPLRLIYLDLFSVIRLYRLLPKLFLPLYPFISGPLDELSGSWDNIKVVTLHLILIIFQLSLLACLPVFAILLWFVPAIGHVVVFGGITLVTDTIAWLLNGNKRAECLVGMPVDAPPVNDETELWFFINGIGTGYVPPSPVTTKISIQLTFTQCILIGKPQTNMAPSKSGSPRQNIPPRNRRHS